MSKSTIRVASYNILCGQRGSPGDFAAALEPLSFDIIGLSETPSGDWVSQLGNELGMHHTLTGEISTAGHVDKYKAIVSRYPLENSKEIPITGSRWGQNCSTVQADILWNERRISFYSLHIPKNPTRLNSGVDDLVNRIFTNDPEEILIATGDYNAHPEHETIQYLDRHGYRSAWHDLGSSKIPISTMEHDSAGVIDHLVYRKCSSLEVMDGGTVDQKISLSDHVCIWFELGIF